MRPFWRAAAALIVLAAVPGPAEARSVEFRGRANAGPLPWCLTVQGYNITEAEPKPQPGACIRGTGAVATDRVGICMTGPILVNVRWRSWRGCD